MTRSKVSRRAFMTNSLWTAGAVCGTRAFALVREGKPDLIVLAKTVHSMDSRVKGAQGIAISGDRILALGSRAEIGALAGAGTRVIDVGDATVVPGFIDAHSHPLSANEVLSVNVDLRSIASIQAALRSRADKTPPGEWVLGHAYDDTKLSDKRPLLRRDLDEVSKAHPILVTHRGGHTGVASTRAFEKIGVDRSTQDPEGGRFYRDSEGLTGRVAERALQLFSELGALPAATREDNKQNARLSTKRMAAAGLTSVTDAGCAQSEYTAYLDAFHTGELSTRIAIMPTPSAVGSGALSLYELLKALGHRSGDGGHYFRIDAVKYFADGSASERTMRMSTPFEGRPDDYGILTMSQEEIDAAVEDATASGFRIGIHANGDVAIDMVLKAYERVLRNRSGPNPRHRIEHCSLVNPELLRRIKQTGTIPTPFYTYAHYHGEKWVEYGETKMRWMFAHKSFLEYDIPVAPASDYLPGPFEPMMALQSLTTRKDAAGRVWGPNQRVSTAEALRICTVNGAYASFEEDVKGTLTPGKFADLVVLERDPLLTDHEALKEIKVLRTIMGGRVTHEA